MSSTDDVHPLHRSAEIEDLSHITKVDEINIKYESLKTEPDNLKTTTNLHRSEEMEDLSHLSSKDMNKPLNTDDPLRTKATSTAESTHSDLHHQPLASTFGSTSKISQEQQQQFPLNRSSEMEDIQTKIPEESDQLNLSPSKNEQRKLTKCNTVIGDSSKYN